MQKEAKARLKINNLLVDSGWNLLDKDNLHANVVLENNVKITQNEIDDFGENFEKTKNGFVDFLLLDERSFPLVVLEAKSEDKDPLNGKEQARKYANSLNVRFVILSNGNIHYFWDLERGNPEIITEFPSQESLLHRSQFKPNNQNLADEQVDQDYVALSQQSNFKEDPLYLDESKRSQFIRDKGLRVLRPYQVNAVKSLQKSAIEGKDRFLFEMATGTGKTLVSAAIMKLFLKTGNAKRILFLVDRIELEDQAYKNFSRYLGNEYISSIYKQNKDSWRKAEIVITTIQSLTSQNKYKKLFSPTDFDLVISDESHRSIGGNARAVFEYFIGFKLGLTATPRDYLKNVKEDEITQRAWEKRQLLDTYKTFGCESGEPTFKYTLLDGVKDGYLVNPLVVDARTDITTELLSEEGYAVVVKNEEGEDEEKTFFMKDFERKFFSDQTNLVFCKTFIENALKDPVTGEIGKSIIFCVSQKHASKVTQILNQLAHQVWPDKYNSDFAVQVTSSITDSQQFTINFVNNNLNGHSKWSESYKTSKTRVCVTVGMMTTGYDCEDILNLCLMRPIFSPTDFVQMKGRGTRMFKFRYTDEQGQIENKTKEHFKLFDFFANCEYFEEKFNYDEVLKLPPLGSSGGEGGEGKSNIDISIFDPDKIKQLKESAVGIEGMKVDRKLFERAKEAIQNDSDISKAVKEEHWENAINFVREKFENKPDYYLNLEKIRKSENLDRRVTWREFLEKIFGHIEKFKSKDELLEEECEKFISIYKPDSKDVPYIYDYIKAYATDEKFRHIIDNGHFGELHVYPGFSMQEFRNMDEKWRKTVPEYVKDYVPLNTYL